jgi:hypothetical protein
MSQTNNPIILKDIWGSQIEESRAYHIQESLRKRKEFDLSQNKGKKK